MQVVEESLSEKEGFTNFCVAAATNAIVESIVRNEKRTMPLSVCIDGFCGVRDVCLSIPVVVGKRGVERVLKPALNAGEIEEFQRSAAIVRTAIRVDLSRPRTRNDFKAGIQCGRGGTQTG